jgi:hypothetical protein
MQPESSVKKLSEDGEEEEDEEDGGFGDNAIDQLLGGNSVDQHQLSVQQHEESIEGEKGVKMSQTLRNLSGTFKEAKAALASGKVEDLSALNDDY